MKKYEVWLYRWLALGWILLLSCESSRPGSEVHIEPPADKAIHMGAFGVLAFLLALGAGRRLERWAFWLVPLFVAILGILDEYHQAFSPGRTVSAGDALADAMGGLSATIGWWLARRQGEQAARNR